MKLLDALSGRVTRGARFREYVDQSFAEVDHNANGSLDRAELHLAVMLFFDKLNAKVRKRAIPPTKAELMALFDEVDTDADGILVKLPLVGSTNTVSPCSNGSRPSWRACLALRTAGTLVGAARPAAGQATASARQQEDEKR